MCTRSWHFICVNRVSQAVFLELSFFNIQIYLLTFSTSFFSITTKFYRRLSLSLRNNTTLRNFSHRQGKLRLQVGVVLEKFMLTWCPNIKYKTLNGEKTHGTRCICALGAIVHFVGLFLPVCYCCNLSEITVTNWCHSVFFIGSII